MSPSSSLKLLCLLLVFLTSLVSADNTNTQERHKQFQEPEKTGETLVYQWQGGLWRYQSVVGSFRVVITKAPENEANKLYLQWWRDIEGSKELSYSLSVKELNISPAYHFEAAKCLNSNCDSLSISATHIHEEYSQEIAIKLEGLGSYSISWQ